MAHFNKVMHFNAVTSLIILLGFTIVTSRPTAVEDNNVQDNDVANSPSVVLSGDNLPSEQTVEIVDNVNSPHMNGFTDENNNDLDNKLSIASNNGVDNSKPTNELFNQKSIETAPENSAIQSIPSNDNPVEITKSDAKDSKSSTVQRLRRWGGCGYKGLAC